MSHEQMLQWLDQANSGTVQAAADRLAAAAKEIHKIADELKVRPQWVEWKGEGADAFRTWTADLANSTLRLGDFSESSAKWLAQASDAIARAQAAIPRTAEGAEGNLVAAASAPNDPDADAISTKSSSELAALAANKEKVRQEAADEMIKLGQAYEFSATQLNALERPKFPPPPEAFVPPDAISVDEMGDRRRSTTQVQSVTSSAGDVSADRPRNLDTAPDTSDIRRSLDSSSSERGTQTKDTPPTRMGIDSVDTLLPDKQPVMGQPGNPPGTERTDGARTTPHTGWAPPLLGREAPVSGPPTQGRPTATGRTPQLPGQMPSSSGAVRGPTSTGIVGGRPVVPPLGGQAGPVHRGTVVGAPGTTGHAPLGPTVNPATPAGRVIGQHGQTAGGRIPASNGGVIGGTPQRTGRAVTGPASMIGSGAAGSDRTSSGAARGGVVGGVPNSTYPGESRGTNAPHVPRSASSAGADSANARPRRLREQEGTPRQGNGRPVPPVID
ncbi:translation initiation factor IF-2 [Streptomyces ipomoeae]|uniref:translation initiation factor IF-2 n=1 Tax=Streptomyces ipomoeae TaxID=103232 RepID=UPI0029A33269|nr:translation initiation factor IF-2 [Streptomyces ipomoeae]MDX2825360.1 translation initiation factor IF-2 [Streptomyces ipomoeae]MDX2877975.1 translation initiation factor IF-2 [Streptomyces ipomoeae]